MSRVADGHFLEETRSAVDIEGKHVTMQGPSPDLCPASPFAPSTGCQDLQIRRYPVSYTHLTLPTTERV